MNWQNRIYESLTEAKRPKAPKSKKVVKDITGTPIEARTGHQFSANAKSYDRRGDQSKAAAAKNDSFRNPERHYTIHASGLRSKRTGEPIARRR
tara:strand:+ start:1345 stop:1626 length:282 start_codon:yes stop_codon:yes gene_type:complete